MPQWRAKLCAWPPRRPLRGGRVPTRDSRRVSALLWNPPLASHSTKPEREEAGGCAGPWSPQIRALPRLHVCQGVQCFTRLCHGIRKMKGWTYAGQNGQCDRHRGSGLHMWCRGHPAAHGTHDFRCGVRGQVCVWGGEVSGMEDLAVDPVSRCRATAVTGKGPWRGLAGVWLHDWHGAHSGLASGLSIRSEPCGGL